MPQMFTGPDAIAEAIVREVGKDIVLGLPLGLGKANHIANALFNRAARDPSIKLRIFTALTLEKPRGSSELERRFLDPVIARLFGGYPDLEYTKALRKGALPPNIEVNEFFFLAGRWLNNPLAQQKYISANYTHAFRYLMQCGVNVIAQLVAERDGRYSLSCNPDLTIDLLRERASGNAKFILTGQVNNELPFMSGEGDLSASDFSHVLQSPATEFPLFAPPKLPLDDAEYAIGLNIARLVPDGGTLQIGIGQEGDATVQGLLLRHKNPTVFAETIARLSPANPGGFMQPFEKGLYGLSEMVVDGFLALIDAGVIKREVDGVLLHGGFFLGPQSFYRRLLEMPEALRDKIRMMPISFTNELFGDEAAKRAARVSARFINSGMMATLLGDVVSDQLEDGRVVSGVGGQYNFVAQAFALGDARSILNVTATRGSGNKIVSNIRWSYGHTTIPRHLRDIIVTEYGVADLRGKTDDAVIAAMLSVADSRFQPQLLAQAKQAGKIAKTYEIPAAHRNNTPERIAAALKPARDAGLLPDYPLGCDFDATEQRLYRALRQVQAATASPVAVAALALKGLSVRPEDRPALTRMGLDRAKSPTEALYRALLAGALKSL
ncbi:MAG TPA: acetyl-CoA hydrolase/transferase C-terminal domain-containing protein [Rhizomicrobium sp.]|nr:acetyl-CoA hydrolase/transferase C-terminal domain-containing protein [Rhizomicrobium sp.]